MMDGETATISCGRAATTRSTLGRRHHRGGEGNDLISGTAMTSRRARATRRPGARAPISRRAGCQSRRRCIPDCRGQVANSEVDVAQTTPRRRASSGWQRGDVICAARKAAAGWPELGRNLTRPIFLMRSRAPTPRDRPLAQQSSPPTPPPPPHIISRPRTSPPPAPARSTTPRRPWSAP
jgi:hypothetical protein